MLILRREIRWYGERCSSHQEAKHIARLREQRKAASDRAPGCLCYCETGQSGCSSPPWPVHPFSWRWLSQFDAKVLIALLAMSAGWNVRLFSSSETSKDMGTTMLRIDSLLCFDTAYVQYICFDVRMQKYLIVSISCLFQRGWTGKVCICAHISNSGTRSYVRIP